MRSFCPAGPTTLAVPRGTLDVNALPPAVRIPAGDRLEVEVVQPDGGRALVVGKLDTVPESAGATSSTRAPWASAATAAGMSIGGSGSALSGSGRPASRPLSHKPLSRSWPSSANDNRCRLG
jgi:hypothetical protein